MLRVRLRRDTKLPNVERCLVEGGSDSLATSASPWLIVALEEYKALRTEIVDSIHAQRTIMQLGVTGVSVLIGLGLQQAPSLLASIILAMLVPSVTFFITTAAWGELFRAARASRFLAEREDIINEAVKGVGSPAMAWKRWLRSRPISSASTGGQFLCALRSYYWRSNSRLSNNVHGEPSTQSICTYIHRPRRSNCVDVCQRPGSL